MLRDPHPLRAIVFDVDGTLYDQGPMRRAMLARLGAECVRHPVQGARTLRALRAYRQAQEDLRKRGAIAADQIRAASDRTGLSADVVAAAVTRWMEREPLALLHGAALGGIAEFLAAAAARGLRLGVLSDYPPRAKLAALGIAPYFDAVVCAQDPEVGVFKPDPRGLRLVLEQLDVPSTETLYVGDRPEVDGVMAARAGVAAVIVGRRTLWPRPAAADGGTPHVADFPTLHRALFGAGSTTDPSLLQRDDPETGRASMPSRTLWNPP